MTPAGRRRSARLIQARGSQTRGADGGGKMIIHFERTGGFAGISLRAVIDSDLLEPEEQRTLEEMIESIGFFDLPPELTSSRPGADRFHYALSVQSHGERHTVEMDEEAVPEDMLPFLQQLSLLARRFRQM